MPLRSSANQMSYFNKEKFATDDALNIGRVHCLQEGWDDALVSFMQSGGFAPSTKVPTIRAPTLILWGRQDKVSEARALVVPSVCITVPSPSLAKLSCLTLSLLLHSCLLILCSQLPNYGRYWIQRSLYPNSLKPFPTLVLFGSKNVAMFLIWSNRNKHQPPSRSSSRACRLLLVRGNPPFVPNG